MRLEFPPGVIFYAAGKVVHGFGRGSKQLGVPTANLEESVVSRLPASLQNGIYFGWAKVDQHPVTKTVVSVGWNPFFKNSKRSVEAHLMGKVDGDFYGSVIQLLILKYHRPETDFVNLTALIECIHEDIREAERYLDQPEACVWRNSTLFSSTPLFNSPTPKGA
ncbi:hypothetical protein P879_06462 [Paragonimus westermani]|uniref:riboflavin kinase n=1 Tax=Paragonimus westermani TaxID=34504 RepID=A0A8T0DT96_9TREM|nr:hypothetical protein P879_06462 [Paragonimus westermani]